MLIDIHHHFNKSYYPDIDEYLETMVKTAEEYKVDKFCLSGLGECYHNYENKDVEYAFKKFSHLIIGFAYIDLDREKVEKIKEYKNRGFKGVKFINPYKPYDDERYFKIYEEVAKQKMVCLFHTGIVAPSSCDKEKHTSGDKMRPIRLEAIARTFPELKIIGAHFGWPWYNEANAVMGVNDNIYFDTTGGTFMNFPEPFRSTLTDSVKFEKFVFGTDSLAKDFGIPFERCKKIFKEMELSEEIQKKIFGENAAGFLGIK